MRIPTDFHIFQDGFCTTNQYINKLINIPSGKHLQKTMENYHVIAG